MSVHASVDIGCFHFGAIVKDADVSVGVRVSLPEPVFGSLGRIPRGGTAGSYSDSVFRFLRNLCTTFPGSCAFLFPHLHSRGFQLFHIHVSTWSLFPAHEEIPCCGLICIYLQTSDGEPLPTHLWLARYLL